MSPSWSPDGKQILYTGSSGRSVGSGSLSIMNADGSGRRVVGVPSSADYATWAPNGKIVFVRLREPSAGDSGGYPGGDLYAVNPDGSGLEQLTQGASMILPFVSPDGSTIAAYAQDTDRLIAVPYGADGPAVTLLERASRYFPNGGMPLAHWVPDGMQLVLGSSNRGESGGAGLFLVNADGSGLTRIPNVTRALGPDWRPRPTPSSSPAEVTYTPGRMGSLAYGLDGDIYVADWDGSDPARIANGEPDTCNSYWGQRSMWSPDGRYLAYRSRWDDVCAGKVYISDPRGQRITSFRGEGWDIAWSPDSTRLASWERLGRTIGIYGPDGVRQKLLTLPPGLIAGGDHDPVWSPDGASLVGPGGVEIPLDGSTPRRLPADDPRSHYGFWYSPDGARVAYLDKWGGELVVAAADGSQARVLVPGGVQNPVWSPTSDRIAFAASTGEAMTNMGPATELRLVDVASGTVTKLTGVGAFDQVIGFSPDGARILFSRENANGAASLRSIRADGSGPRRIVTGTDSGEWQQ